MQEFRTDTVVEADAARHLLHVGADFFRQIGDLVDEGDLGGEEGVGRVFDQLGGAPVGEQNRRAVEIERPIKLRHHLPRARIVAADHDTIGMLEVADGGALAQEFRIGHHRAVGVGPRFADDALDLVAGADRHGGLGDDHGEAVERGGDFARGFMNEGQVCVAVAAARGRADGDEHRVGGFDRAGEIVAEFQPPGARIGGNQIVEPRLVDRHLAARQRRHLAGVLVDASHLMAEIGKAGPGDEADIAGADHGDAHFVNPPGK